MTDVDANAQALLNVLALGQWDVETAREAVDVLEEMGRDAVPVLTEALQRPRRGSIVRAVAASLLGRIGGRRALRALRAACEDTDHDVARVVRASLDRLGAQVPRAQIPRAQAPRAPAAA